MDFQSKLYTFLNQHRSDNEEKPTHLSYGSFNGKFNLDNISRKEFMSLYSDCIKNNVELCMLEKQKEYSCILVDIDLNDNYNEGMVRLYNNNMIKGVIQAYKEVIKKYVDMYSLQNIKISVFEKPKYTIKNDKIKDGFHIIFDNLVLDANIRHMIRNEVIDICKEKNVFKNNNESVDKIIDKAVVESNGWFLYGSRKSGCEPYVLTKYYSFESDMEQNIEEIKDDIETLISYYSLQSSSYKETRQTKLNEDIIKNNTCKKGDNVEKKTSKITEEIDINNKYKEIESLVSLISNNRLDDYNEWIKIGLAIYNELMEEGLEIFLNFTSSYHRYNREADKKTYLNFKCKDDGVKIGTLKYYAKQDNLKEYLRLYSFNFNDTTTGAIADYFKVLYGDEFIYCNDTLYYYNNVYWMKDDNKKSIIHNFIDKTYFEVLFKKYQDYELKNIKNENMRNQLDKIRNNILNIRNIKKRKEYIEDICNKLTNNNIKFDEIPNLFSFNNKLYDTKLMKFIKPEPSYFISMTTGYDYDINYDKKKIDDLQQLINTILKDEIIRNFYLTIISTGMMGQNLEKFIVCSGCGGNGKGLLNGLAMCMFGSDTNNYSYKLKSSLLSESQKTGSNPELANCHNKRFIVAQEPDKNKNIKVSIMKELTGDCSINARLNHSNNTNTLLKSTLILECNDKPNLDEVDEAVLRRLITIPFKSKFVDSSLYDPEDKSIDGIINDTYKTQNWKDEYKQALFEIIIQRLKDYNKNGLILPTEITNENKKYLQQSDKIYQFIDDKYIMTNNNKDCIKMKEVFNEFKNSEIYINMTKKEKGDLTYKNFDELLSKNLFLKKFIKKDKSNVLCLYNYKLKPYENTTTTNDLDI